MYITTHIFTDEVTGFKHMKSQTLSHKAENSRAKNSSQVSLIAKLELFPPTLGDFPCTTLEIPGTQTRQFFHVSYPWRAQDHAFCTAGCSPTTQIWCFLKAPWTPLEHQTEKEISKAKSGTAGARKWRAGGKTNRLCWKLIGMPRLSWGNAKRFRSSIVFHTWFTEKCHFQSGFLKNGFPYLVLKGQY